MIHLADICELEMADSSIGCQRVKKSNWAGEMRGAASNTISKLAFSYCR